MVHENGELVTDSQTDLLRSIDHPLTHEECLARLDKISELCKMLPTNPFLDECYKIMQNDAHAQTYDSQDDETNLVDQVQLTESTSGRTTNGITINQENQSFEIDPLEKFDSTKPSSRSLSSERGRSVPPSSSSATTPSPSDVKVNGDTPSYTLMQGLLKPYSQTSVALPIPLTGDLETGILTELVQSDQSDFPSQTQLLRDTLSTVEQDKSDIISTKPQIDNSTHKDKADEVTVKDDTFPSKPGPTRRTKTSLPKNLTNETLSNNTTPVHVSTAERSKPNKATLDYDDTGQQHIPQYRSSITIQIDSMDTIPRSVTNFAQDAALDKSGADEPTKVINPSHELNQATASVTPYEIQTNTGNPMVGKIDNDKSASTTSGNSSPSLDITIKSSKSRKPIPKSLSPPPLSTGTAPETVVSSSSPPDSIEDRPSQQQLDNALKPNHPQEDDNKGGGSKRNHHNPADLQEIIINYMEEEMPYKVYLASQIAEAKKPVSATTKLGQGSKDKPDLKYVLTEVDHEKNGKIDTILEINGRIINNPMDIVNPKNFLWNDFNKMQASASTLKHSLEELNAIMIDSAGSNDSLLLDEFQNSSPEDEVTSIKILEEQVIPEVGTSERRKVVKNLECTLHDVHASETKLSKKALEVNGKFVDPKNEPALLNYFKKLKETEAILEEIANDLKRNEQFLEDQGQKSER
ncbi:mucin-5AC-like [Folsomia candida]|uniref:mucin-5AC-like n=1 Tax=Folsomia candida TaxID=158441 RepID=UPI001604B1BF|nr:mucin-5AC-like [Folsomia candida]